MFNIKDLRYLTAYTLPLCTLIGLTQLGHYTYLTIFYAFGFLPILDMLLPKRTENLEKEEAEKKELSKVFDWLLYVNLLLVFGLLVLFLTVLNKQQLSGYELGGLISAVGITFSVNGINVGHELGHRNDKLNQWIGKLLYLPSLYMHFFIEHNLGHHKNVGTDLDPASAKRNEIIYLFWLRSMIGTVIGACRIEMKRLKSAGISFLSLHNQILQFIVIQGIFLYLIFLYSGWFGLSNFLICALISIVLLESINYIEHYGLRRKLLSNGRYERVMPHHSWNSNHELGRIVLYELTRHSDHHYISNKKYQLLDHHEDARQLPLGYPASIVLALLPPVWFMVMNPRI